MLKKYFKENNISILEFCRRTGITSQTIHNILNKRSSKTYVITCNKIERETGLKAWEYLDGLDNLKGV